MSGTSPTLSSLIWQAPKYACLSYLSAIMASLVQILPFFWVYLLLQDPAYGPILWLALTSFCLHPLLFAISTFFAHQSAFAIQHFLRKKLFQRLIDQPLSNHHHRGWHKTQKILSEDIDILELFYAHQLPELIATLSNLCISLAFISYLNWQMTVIFLIMIGSIFAIASFILRNHEAQIKIYFQKLARLSQIASDFIIALDLIKSPQTGHYVAQSYHKAIADFSHFSLSWFKNWGKGWGLYVVVSQGLLICLLPPALLLISQNILSIDSFMPIALILNGLTPFILRLMNYSEVFLRVRLGMANIADFLSQPISPAASEPAAFPVRANKLVLDNVSFTPPPSDRAITGKTLLNGLQCDIPLGQLTCLFGPSGSGKTTLLSLIAGYHAPDRGTIYLQGDQSSPLDPSHIGFCHQDALFIDGSLRDNIILDQDLRPDDFDEALQIAAVTDFIPDLPQNIDTPVGYRGQKLSGGQRQRLALARAIYHRSPILLLDELSAHLDPKTAWKILTNLQTKLPDITIILITHCPVQAEASDHVILLSAGQIQAQGAPDILRAQSPTYKHYLQKYAALIAVMEGSPQ